jgi:predicted nucleic acid-binding Zn finger protein
VLRQACQEIRRANTIPDDLKTILEKTFTKRYTEASKLVDQGKVLQVRFSPSHRTIWVVKGRRADYQVVPESMFCTCDDYYFRVMGRKKQLCYHLVAQLLAEALDKQQQADMQDSSYAGFTAKWKPSEVSA